MLRSFVAWLDKYLAGEGPSAVLRAVLGLLSFAALLGTLLGSVAVKTGATVAVLLALLSAALLLIADRRSTRGRLKAYQVLLSHYGRIFDEMHPTYDIVSWEQTAYVVSDRGDTKEYAILRVRVLRPDMHYVRLIFGCGWPQPKRYRQRVDVSVRNLLEGGVPGTTPRHTVSWLADGKFDMMIHFHKPPRAGSEIRFVVAVDWPGKCEPLMNEKTDDFSFTFLQRVEFVRYRIVLPAGQEAWYEPIGFETGDPSFRIDAGSGEDGRCQYVFYGVDVPVRANVGVRLELKGKGERGARQWPAVSALR
jgi:hypothetical protein